MNLRNIGIVYRKELREALRDRRTMVSSLLVPLILFPLLTAGIGAAFTVLLGKAEKEIPAVMILGGEDSPGILAELRGDAKLKIVPTTKDWKDKIVNKDIRAAIDIPAGFQDDLAHQKLAKLLINNFKGDIKSAIATGNVKESLERFKDRIIHDNLAAKNLPE